MTSTTLRDALEGPWTFDGPDHDIIVWSSPENRVCFMTSNGPTRARARLIAAAPDLLEAAKSALIFVENEEYILQRKFSCGDKLRDAIAKAEGRS